MNDHQRAKTYLQQSRDLSMGRAWTAKKELDEKERTVFVESCILLYKAMIREILVMMYIDPQRAARMCSIARKRALDGSLRQL